MKNNPSIFTPKLDVVVNGKVDSKKGNKPIPNAIMILTTKTTVDARKWMTFLLIFTDIFSLVLAFTLAILLRISIIKYIPIYSVPITVSRTFSLWPILLLIILAFTLRGLYPAVGLSPVDELRITTTTVSLVFLVLLGGTFWIKSTEIYSRFILTLAWLFSLVLVQFNRWLLRVITTKSLWGEPIVVIGDGPNTDRIVKYLSDNNHLGMRPAMVLEGRRPPNQDEQQALKSYGIQTALLVTPEVSKEISDLVINDGHFGFKRLILISILGWVGSLGVVTHDLEGILGMEVRHNLMNFWQCGLKRILDIILAILLLILISPLLLIVSIAISLEGPGGVIYKQTRIGRNGTQFKMLKFRTMIPNAHEQLQSRLDADASLREEWEINQKLKNDPRLTKVGKVLRKWSIDEWPQLVNVIRGEMSLVGPRPFFPEQVRLYGKTLNHYYRVRPGMTGMWQVTSRNESTFSDRIRLDEYYIRNWSIWLDVYILLRTTWVVLRQKGAY
jgi:Undecaprenyl-phosphate galactose phosphotransferase WbaP